MTQTNTSTQIFQLQLQLRDIPGLPIKKDPCGTMTHDLQTQGDDHAFAALDTLQARSSENATRGIVIRSS
jgi:hypothetical protein